MIKDPGTKKALAEMTGIEERITGNSASDYKLIDALKKDAKIKDRKQYKCCDAYTTHLIKRDNACLSLVYLMLFHRSALVRHEAAFALGQNDPKNSFLRDSAILDQNPVVRHEACLAMGNNSRHYSRNNYLLEYIAANDKSKMVRDSARVALDYK